MRIKQINTKRTVNRQFDQSSPELYTGRYSSKKCKLIISPQQAVVDRYHCISTPVMSHFFKRRVKASNSKSLPELSKKHIAELVRTKSVDGFPTFCIKHYSTLQLSIAEKVFCKNPV